MPVRKTVYLSLGSNVGNRAANLKTAIERLGELGEVSAVSSFYETEPVEYTRQAWFLNCAVAMETEKLPQQFLAQVMKIEKELGRKRRIDKGPRTIDIDVLMFGAAVIETPQLTVPHVSMHERRFVLEPLAEIAPEARHPVFKKTVRELRDALGAGGAVKKVLRAEG